MSSSKLLLRAGVGAKCSIYTRFLHPKLHEYADQKDHRSSVVLISAEKMKVNKKMIDCYTCSVEGIDDAVFHAARTHFKMEQNGPEGFDSFFIPLTEEEKEQQRQIVTSGNFQEPRKKWKKSQARKILYEMIMDGTIDDEDNEDENIHDIYLMHEEFLKYDFGKFEERLSTLRGKIQELNKRANDDEKAFEEYIFECAVVRYLYNNRY